MCSDGQQRSEFMMHEDLMSLTRFYLKEGRLQ